MCQRTYFFAKFLNKWQGEAKMCIGIFIWLALFGTLFYITAVSTFYGLEILTHIGYDLNTGCPKDDLMCGSENKMVCYNDNMTPCFSLGALIGMMIWATVFNIIFIMYIIRSAIKEWYIPPVNSVIDEKTSLYDFSSNARNETIK